MKICKSILPVKAKLLGKLSCLQEQSLSLEIPSHLVKETNNVNINSSSSYKNADILSTSTSTSNPNPSTLNPRTSYLDVPYNSSLNIDPILSVADTNNHLFNSQIVNLDRSIPSLNINNTNNSIASSYLQYYPDGNSSHIITNSNENSVMNGYNNMTNIGYNNNNNIIRSNINSVESNNKSTSNNNSNSNSKSNISSNSNSKSNSSSGSGGGGTGNHNNNNNNNNNSNNSNNNNNGSSNNNSTNNNSKRKYEGNKNRDANAEFPTVNEVKNDDNLPQSDEYMSSRRRRRLSQIVPNPRKPRQADYICSVCGECYTVTVLENPWWAVYEHDCPRCRAIQIPRIDINIQANAIELDPNVVALYGEGVDDSVDENCDNDEEDDVEEETEKSATNVEVKDEAEVTQDVNLFDGEGLLKAEEASKLLVLMCHARTCTGDHSQPKHNEICKSTKFLMLHIRDCDGTDVHGRECQFPWCSPCKRMLVHLTRCLDPNNCKICNPFTLSQCYQQLHHLNKVRLYDEPHNMNTSSSTIN